MGYGLSALQILTKNCSGTLRSRRNVHIHYYHGPGRHAYGMGDNRDRDQGMGGAQGGRSPSEQQ